MWRQLSLLLVGVFFLAACSSPVASSTLTAPPSTSTAPPVPSHTLTSAPPVPSSTPAPPDLDASATPEVQLQVCSPLAGYALEDLSSIVSNPYQPPRPGSDDPHQAVDLAERMDGSGMALAGMPVQAVLPGRVVLAQSDRFPYGNAVIVETPLEVIPELLRETAFMTLCSGTMSEIRDCRLGMLKAARVPFKTPITIRCQNVMTPVRSRVARRAVSKAFPL